LDRNNTRNPRTVITDRLGSYRGAIRAMKRDGGFGDLRVTAVGNG
jgi:hypothetical protein